jgi:hypothetical protein
MYVPSSGEQHQEFSERQSTPDNTKKRLQKAIVLAGYLFTFPHDETLAYSDLLEGPDS